MITDKGKKMALAHLGLDPEKHNDDDVADIIRKTATPKEIDDLKNRAKAGDDAIASLADADLAKHAAKIGTDPEVIAGWKQDLVKNRAATVKRLEAIPAPAAPIIKKPIHNREGASNPAPIDQNDPAADLAKVKENSLIRNRAKELEASGVPMQLAHLRAAEEIPIEIKAGLHK